MNDPKFMHQDPGIQRLIVAARRSQSRRVSRRSALALAGGGSLAALLAACGTGGAGTSTNATPGATAIASLKPAATTALNVANWTQYIDQNDDGSEFPTLAAFEKANGVTVEYSEDINDNNEYWGKIQGQLAQGQDIGEDLIVVTEWLVSRMIALGYGLEPDPQAIPLTRNVVDSLKDPAFDPGRKHSVTWQAGFTGLAYNKEAYPQGIKTLDDLWAPALKGKVEVFYEMRDTMGLILRSQGVDISGTWGQAEFDKGLEVLETNIKNGQIRQVKGNDYKQDLITGDAVATMAWSGDITQINAENGDKWAFVMPESGGTIWSDNMVIPRAAPNALNAQKFMDYYYQPEVAAQVAAYVQFICPVQGAREAMASVDPSLVDNELIFPSDETLRSVQLFRPLAAAEETSFNKGFAAVVGA
ncbi:spermidine/putrescine ABC transporter substrate-binding protein [Micrococcales bacterium 31B]|nr:spermidine/putrescine ABC transporter substrate-binding protein [Micrococcales bacterium 31B]